MIKFIVFLFVTLRREFGRFKYFEKLNGLFKDCYFPETMKIVGPLPNLKLDKNVRFGHFSYLHLGGETWSIAQGSLEIGSDGNLSSHCVIYAAGPEGVRIGKNFDCAPGVKIYSSRSFFEDGQTKHIFGKVHIGDNVIVYSNVVIGPNVVIGDNVSIAANSVVTKDLIEPGLYGGAPAVKLKPF